MFHYTLSILLKPYPFFITIISPRLLILSARVILKFLYGGQERSRRTKMTLSHQQHQIQLIIMALLTAGKQITSGSPQAFGRGLFVVDPQVAERQANKKASYQAELLLQMEEQKRKKQEAKRREQEQDQRLQRKFHEDLERDKKRAEKNVPNLQRNDKNEPPPPPQQTMQRSQITRKQMIRQEPIPIQRREEVDFRFNVRTATETDAYYNPYLQRQPNLNEMQQQQYIEESNSQKIRAMREMLDQKMNEVYRRLHQSKDLEVDKELELIRQKLAQNNAIYEQENPKIPQLQNNFSHFYRVPKKNGYEATPIKNLDYDSRTVLKRNNFIPQRNLTPQRNEQPYARSRISRDSSKNNDGWGVKKGKNNFLGNRQAADYQIESLSNNIQNILDHHG